MKPADLIRLLSLSAIWGSSFLLMRLTVPELGVISTAFYRELLGVLGLVAVLAATRTSWRFEGKLHFALALGVLNSAVPFILFSAAAKVLPAGYSAIFNATTPLMGVILGALFFCEKLSLSKFFGVVLGLTGVGVLSRSGPIAFGLPEMLGALACLCAAACYALAGFLTHRWVNSRGGLDSKLLAFGSQAGATALMIPLFGYQAMTSGVNLPTQPSIWAALLMLGLGCSTLAYILYFRLIADIGPVKSMSVTFLVPLFGVLFGAAFLGEALSMAHLIGGAMIGLALLLVFRTILPIKFDSLPLPQGNQQA